MEYRGVRDLSHVDDSDLFGMLKVGFGPDDINMRPLTLHHFRQRPVGPLIEVPRDFHLNANVRQHPYRNARGMGLTKAERDLYNQTQRPAYWKARAKDELMRRGKWR